MLFDTDVLIWHLRGNLHAAQAVNEDDARSISVVTFMELLQGARDRQEVRAIKRFLFSLQFHMLPLTENIGHRASIYLEEYGLSTGLGMADSLLAATAVENQERLLTSDEKHYKVIRDLDLRVFRP
jgi:predicted nucleic acid-binding protein